MINWRRLVAAYFLTLATLAQAARATTIDVAVDPDPPESGENALILKLSDAAGKAVTGASIDALFYMPAMGSMARMEEPAKVQETSPGRYEGEFRLSMGGTWELTLTIARKGEEKETFRYSVTTGIPGVMNKNAEHAPASKKGAPQAMDVGPRRLQQIGVRFAEARLLPMTKTVRAIGVVEQDKTHREEITMRSAGYIVRQYRGRVGDAVKRGDPLFSIYSPELVTAQSEFLLTEKLGDGGHRSLHQSAEERLVNLGLTRQDIASLKKSGKPIRDVTMRSTIAGTILEVNAREGSAVGLGQVLYVIGDLSRSYIVARVFQQDVGDLRIGQDVEIIVPDSGTSTQKGRVDLIYPEVERGAGTTNVRIEVEDYVKDLRPGVYVDLRFPVSLGTRLAIPTEAVLHSGLHQYVFVDLGEGMLEPRAIKTGRKAGDQVEVSEGLAAGERVAASGTFLLSSEAQLRSALPKWGGDAATAADGEGTAP